MAKHEDDFYTLELIYPDEEECNSSGNESNQIDENTDQAKKVKDETQHD